MTPPCVGPRTGAGTGWLVGVASPCWAAALRGDGRREGLLDGSQNLWSHAAHAGSFSASFMFVWHYI
jgi:hypothetical protein